MDCPISLEHPIRLAHYVVVTVQGTSLAATHWPGLGLAVLLGDGGV